MVIDTHCHLNFIAFESDYQEAYRRAIDAGVEKMIVVGTSIESSKKAITLAQELECCLASIAIHPHHLKQFMEADKQSIRDSLLQLVNQPKVVAVGETGIDYYTYKNYPPVTEDEKKAQFELLEIHMQLARENNLPLILHCREAMDDMVAYIIQQQKKYNDSYRGVLHCFSGTVEHMKKLVETGFYVGFDGNISYKANQDLRDVIKETPKDRILIETDAPYLTPEPHRGTRNEPARVQIVAEWIARCKNVTIERIQQQTTENAKRLFFGE